ncbi:hypothetical protein ACQPW1_27525 [Nocardia sp. CA-128927]|uniref:hypothetical protein n=1 Tax=Nocardia sp. CA-128927 TaxID=3239975 RepID=UPI003D96E7D5
MSSLADSCAAGGFVRTVAIVSAAHILERCQQLGLLRALWAPRTFRGAAHEFASGFVRGGRIRARRVPSRRAHLR